MMTAMSILNDTPRPKFQPTFINGCVLWLRADVGAFTDTGRTTPVASDGDLIAGWQDYSGQGKHLSQSTSSKRPTWKVNIAGGRPVARLDGVDDFMDAGSAVLSGASAFTALIVHKTTGDNIWAGGIPAVTNNQLRIGQGGTYTLSMFDGANNPISLTAAPARTVWTVATYQNGPHFWVNGVSRDNAGTIGNMSEQRFFIDFGGTTAPVNGDVAEIIIYNVAITTAQRQQVERYLSRRFALGFA
jgi:hypothetical protein